MAKMIPAEISPDIKSNAEKRIFTWFRDDPKTKDWIVLHSLGIVNHGKCIFGEADFVVLVPRMGMYILEVKGGRVSRNDGEWSFTNRFDETNSKSRGPFDQAREAGFSIAKTITEKCDSAHSRLKQLFWGYGVMFPDIEYETVSCDEAEWQVFDSKSDASMYNYIFRLFDGTKKRMKESMLSFAGRNFSSIIEEKLPSVEDVRYIASILRGDFDKAVSISVQIRYTEEELISLTKEQYRCVDQLDDNKRCLITGGAGTGKTLIAVEEAKKAVVQGYRVGIFCYNKKLGAWLENAFDNMPENLRPSYVGTIHKYMGLCVKASGERIDEETEDFFSRELPLKAKECLAKSDAPFDKIIIDEAQDIIAPNYLDFLDTCLSGGLSLGRWVMLGDFSQQAIFSDYIDGNRMIDSLEERTSFIRFKLTINCRNTKKICDEICLVTGFQSPSEIWSKVEGLPVEYLLYKDQDEEHVKLDELLAKFKEQHLSPEKITILSPFSMGKSVVSTIEKTIIKDFNVKGNNSITFSTIQSFKGLENSVIILTDIDSIKNRNLMYVALSRARVSLFVLESEKAREEYLDMQIRSMSNG